MYQINSDYLYRIGSSHSVCQDYCISGNLRQMMPYIIIADGCSSSPQVDVGCRILVHCAKWQLDVSLIYNQHTEHLDSFADIMGDRIIKDADIIKRNLNLHDQSLDSTLLIAFIYHGNINIITYGDGNFLIKRRDDIITNTRLSYSSGAPYYLNYLTNKERNERYKKEFKDSVFESEVIINKSSTKIEYPFSHHLTYQCPIQDVEFLLLASDGLTTWEDKFHNFIYIPPQEFLNFKNTTGEFVTRRINRITKDMKERNISHYDDLSIAGFHIQEVDNGISD
jgi:hypothetical protein